MDNAELPTSAFGLSWVIAEGRDLITKSLAPSFVFVDYETFANTNVRHRLAKRKIDAYVSLCAPLGLLASMYGWDQAQRISAHLDGVEAYERTCSYISKSMEMALELGADALVICDDLCGSKGPLLGPLFVIEHLIPLYERFAQEARAIGLPIIFHSDGDIREYYPALASAGYTGVHIAHPDFEQTEQLFDAAREVNLVPLGGLVSAQAKAETAETLADFAIALASKGPTLICDDGAVKSLEEFEIIIDALARCRSALDA
ncbi:MAG: hypothetical protein HGA54_08145 [Actinobacteria bacterium]|nr:hypothetical protein [Actinomycetota bacterium]